MVNDGSRGAGRSRALLVDTTLAVTVMVVLVIAIGADQATTRDADALAYGWAVGLGALMFARRRYPRTVLAVTILGVLAYFAAGYPAIPVSVPVAPALFSAAEAGRTRSAVTGAVLLLGVSVVARLVEGDDLSFVVGYELASHIALTGAAIALGAAIRLRRVSEARAERIARLERAEADLLAAQRVRTERLDLARDLHDAIGHALTVVSIHAHVAADRLGVDDAAARTALGHVGDAAAAALRELRGTVDLLRTDGQRVTTPRSAAPFQDIAEAARAAGFEVDVDIAFASNRVPDEVGLVAYRVVQEAVTNAMRHSDGGHLRVAVRTAPDALVVEIEDDGVAGDVEGPTDAAIRGSEPDGAGHGLRGIAERVRSVGGTVEITSTRDGFSVAARLPLERS